MTDAEEVLRTKKVFGLLGASQDTEKYSYELLFTLLDAGYTVYPVNPRYEKIAQHRCYPSLDELPQKPEVAIIVLAPKNTEAILASVVEQGVPVVWMPPGSWSETGIATVKSAGLDVVYNVCPIGTLRMMQRRS